MKSLSVSIAAVACLLASGSWANTITFETAFTGPGFTGPVTEDGYTYSLLSGGLFVSPVVGNPGHDLEGRETTDGGVVKIVAAGGEDFNFDQLDYAAFDGSGSGSQTLTVNGLFNGSVAFTDTYTLANTSSVAGGTYGNWTTEVASVLAGQTIDELDIVLNAGTDVSNGFQEAIDNVVFSAASATPSAPEPDSLALLGAGFAGLGLARRRQRA